MYSSQTIPCGHTEPTALGGYSEWVWFCEYECVYLEFTLWTRARGLLGGSRSSPDACVYFKYSFRGATPRGSCTNQRRRGAGFTERCVDDGKRTITARELTLHVIEREFKTCFKGPDGVEGGRCVWCTGDVCELCWKESRRGEWMDEVLLLLEHREEESPAVWGSSGVWWIILGVCGNGAWTVVAPTVARARERYPNPPPAKGTATTVACIFL